MGIELPKSRQFPTKKKIRKTENQQLTDLFRTPAGGRTLDTLIKSQVLYQLSYGSISFDCIESFDLRLQNYNLFWFWQCFLLFFFILLLNTNQSIN